MTTDNVAGWYETEYTRACQSLAQARAELVQAHIELRQIRKLWLNPAGAAQIRANLASAKREADAWFDRLMQARSELKDLRGANRALVQQVADVTNNREFWYKETQSLEMDLYHAAEEEAVIVEAAEALLRRLSPTVSSDKPILMFEEFTQLRDALEYKSKAAAIIVERLATLDAAEAALAECGIGGVFAEFDGLADAINQMAQHIKELASSLMQAQADLDAAKTATPDRERIWERLTKADLAAHIRDLTQTVDAERRLRQEAERCHKAALTMAQNRSKRLEEAERRAERLYREYTDMHEALDECDISRDYGDGSIAAGRTRIFWLNERAEKAEAANDHLRSVASQVPYLKDRAERAEALAQLVTERLAALLEKLASHTRARADSYANPLSVYINLWHRDAAAACDLAAQIREVLNECQAT